MPQPLLVSMFRLCSSTKLIELSLRETLEIPLGFRVVVFLSESLGPGWAGGRLFACVGQSANGRVPCLILCLASVAMRVPAQAIRIMRRLQPMSSIWGTLTGFMRFLS